MKTLKSTAAAASDRRDPAAGSRPATSPLTAKPIAGSIRRRMEHCAPGKAQPVAEPLPTAAADTSGALQKQCRINKKRRSLTELIEEMDKVNRPNQKKSEPRKPSKRSFAVSKCKKKPDGRLAVVDEEAGFVASKCKKKRDGRLAVVDEEAGFELTGRELKKSKYLSPPYTFSSGFCMLVSHKESKPEAVKNVSQASAAPKNTDSKSSKKVTKILLCSQSKSKNVPSSSKFTRHSVSSKSKASKKATEASCTSLSKLRTITKCTYRPPKGEGVKMLSPMFKIDGVHAEMRSPLFKIDSVPVTKIFLEFLLTTVNPLYLKWRGLAKTVRGFFELYRSSVYLNGSKFDAYREHLINCGEIDGQSASKETINTLKYGKSKGRKKTKDVGDNVLVTEHSEQKKGGSKRKNVVVGVSHLKTRNKRKTRNDTTNVEHPLNLDILQLVGAEAPKKRKKSNAYTCKTHGSGHESVGGVEMTKKRKMMPKGEEVSSLIIPDKLGCQEGDRLDHINGRDAPEMTKKRKMMPKGKEVSSLIIPDKLGCQEGDRLDHINGRDAPETLEDRDGEVNNGMEADETKHKRQKSSFAHEGPAEILLTFAPGITLPSKGHIISTFSKYGHLIEAQTELLKESGCASVVYARTSDAEKALDSRDLSRAFGFPVPSYRLRRLPGSFAISPPHMIPTVKPSLFSVKNNLETMISILTGPSDESKPEAKEKLAGQMRDLLKKVNKKLGDRAHVIY